MMSDMNSSRKIWQRCPLYNAQYVMPLNIPSQTYYISYVVGSTCNALMIISGIILNSATILAYWKSSQLRNKTSYFLVMLLSVSDLTVAVVGNVFFFLSLAFTLHGNPNCTTIILHEILTFLTVGMSLATLSALNIERYSCIVYPFFHRTKMTKLKLLRLTVLFWLYSCLVTLCYPVLGDHAARLTTSITLLSDIVITVGVYISIYHAVRRAASNPAQANGNQIKKLQNLKMAKSCVIVVAWTVIGFLPFAIVRSLEASVFTICFLEVWAKTLTLLSSSSNSLLFFWRNPILRKEAKAVLKNPKMLTRCLPVGT